ncbi:hypothetical protein EGW08_003724 [Elysia chlorotica]|uniref:EGF-like domain-containing protein n=1 Tax=Elysia chlorotica TaxID=188477 RepID=A0A433U3S0_ELYCH|nr:hypothetical protein EGW08_003724 [Elysia chlorotica]
MSSESDNCHSSSGISTLFLPSNSELLRCSIQTLPRLISSPSPAATGVSKDNHTAQPSYSPSVSKAFDTTSHASSSLSNELFSESDMRHCTKSFPNFPKCLARISLPRPSKLAVVAALFLVILSLQAQQSDARKVGVCRGIPCANGGRLLVSNSIWGNCRCRCPPSFVGPYCQYQRARKRSSGATPNEDQQSQEEAGPRVSRSQTMDLIRRHLLDLAEMPTPSSLPQNAAGPSDIDDNDESEEIIIDNISRRDADIGLLALSKLVNFASDDLLDDSELLAGLRRPSEGHRVWRAKRVASLPLLRTLLLRR